jgi:quercetin dioxygenase-like cupin family protein
VQEPTVVRPDDQPVYQYCEGVTTSVLIDAVTTDAANLALGLISFEAGTNVPPHTREVEEYIYVIEGSTIIESCGKRFELHAGDAIYIPAGTEHQHKNEHDRTLRQLYVFSPPGPERGVREWPRVDT